MENKFRLKIILIVVTSLVVFIIASIWWFLNSSAIANNSVVIKTRNFYYLNLLPVWGFEKRNLTYAIFPIQKDPKYGYFTYSLLGKFQKIDFNNNLIYIKDKNNQTYIFSYIIKRSPEDTKLVYFEYYDFDKEKNPVSNTVKIDVFEKDKATLPFTKGDIVEIQWESFSTLDQTLSIRNENDSILIVRDEPVLTDKPQVINRYLYEK